MAIPMRRRSADILAFAFATAATLFGLVWLFWILWMTLRQGAAALNPALFNEMTPPPGAIGGGLLNAFYGSPVIILLPIVVRATEESLRLIPDQMREAGVALGLPRWRVTRQILYKAAMSGIMTGILLGVARIAGETAPLLFTALNNQFWSASMKGP